MIVLLDLDFLSYYKVKSKVKVRDEFCFKGNMLVAPDEKNDIAAPSFFQKNKKAIRAACRNLSRHQLRSNNRQKYRKVLARLYRKQANQRRDFHFKLARNLCQKYAIICLESLSMKAMQKGHGKKVNDYGFAEFENILDYARQHIGAELVVRAYALFVYGHTYMALVDKERRFLGTERSLGELIRLIWRPHLC